MMMILPLLIYIAHTELLFAQGDKLILKEGNRPCSGYIKIHYEDKWGYVGDNGWNNSTEKVVCKSTQCGTPLKHKSVNVRMKGNNRVWLNNLECKGSENHLSECKNPGWGVSQYLKPTVKEIQCSDEIELSLDGFKCAGAVRYTIIKQDKTNITGHFCDDNWSKKEADALCNKLNCGGAKSPSIMMHWPEFNERATKTLNCTDINPIEHLWQCITQESKGCKKPASVECNGHEKMQFIGDVSNVCSGKVQTFDGNIWQDSQMLKNSSDLCQHMYCGTTTRVNNKELRCSDSVSVILMRGDVESTKECHGIVYIKKNNSHRFPVCGSGWTKKDAEMVCRELKCGKMISYATKKVKIQGIMDLVNCLGSESSLWHCPAVHYKTAESCQSQVSIVCAESIHVSLKDGPGPCAGRVEIQYEGKWQRIPVKALTKNNSDTVCRQMNCGTSQNQSPSLDKFSPGSSDFLRKTLNCESGGSDISDCFKEEPRETSRDLNEEAMGITCEKHMMVFLSGKDGCSGSVEIQNGHDSYWLSGSDTTWNQESADTVCHQTLCGNASSFSFLNKTDKTDKNIWNKSYNCLNKKQSIFDCENVALSSNDSDTIATVKCSGTKKISLSNTCVGHVLVNTSRYEGGVCANTWTKDMSEKLCQNLDCGKNLDLIKSHRTSERVMFKSLHNAMNSNNLIKSNFVLSDKGMTCDSAYVVCSGSVKVRLSNSRHACSGNVEVFYDDTWLPVCQDALETDTRENICQNLKCGPAGVNISYFGENTDKIYVISKLECSRDNSLETCTVAANRTSCKLSGLQCAGWKKMEVSGTCQGTVSVNSNQIHKAVSSEGWTTTEGKRLCRDMNCGSCSSVHPTNPSEKDFWDGSFSCADEKYQNIWDCETPKTNQSNQPIQSEQKKQQVFIHCEDKPVVNLTERCGGRVTIDNTEVCDTEWNRKYSHMVCQQRGCGNAITERATIPKLDSLYYHINCDEENYELGQCQRVKGKCRRNLVSVYCTGSVEFKTTEKCGGQLQVKIQTQWKNVCYLDISLLPSVSKNLCERLNCNGSAKISQTLSSIASNVKNKIKLECTTQHNDIAYCVTDNSCSNGTLQINCDGYVPPPTTPPPVPGPNIVHIMLGVGLTLILVILITVFVRICIIGKFRKSLKTPWNEAEFESGNFEDMNDKANEMEDFGFRSEDEIVTENDARSNTSFPYDDIDEAAEVQPLTSQATTDGASGNNYINEGGLDQSDDGVTYEVDDPQESYDDIEASPEITQTEVEVHDSAETTERETVAHVGLAEAEKDYLVPGQDG